MGNKLPLEEDNVMKRVCNEFNNSKFNSALVLAEFKGQMAVATMNTLHMNAIMNALGQMAQQANAQIDDNMNGLTPKEKVLASAFTGLDISGEELLHVLTFLNSTKKQRCSKMPVKQITLRLPVEVYETLKEDSSKAGVACAKN